MPPNYNCLEYPSFKPVFNFLANFVAQKKAWSFIEKQFSSVTLEKKGFTSSLCVCFIWINFLLQWRDDRTSRNKKDIYLVLSAICFGNCPDWRTKFPRKWFWNFRTGYLKTVNFCVSFIKWPVSRVSRLKIHF